MTAGAGMVDGLTTSGNPSSLGAHPIPSISTNTQAPSLAFG